MTIENDWVIFYDGGTTFAHNDGEPWQAPPSGVLIVGQKIDGEYSKEQGLGFYIWKDEQWYSVDSDGKDDYLYCQIFDHPKVCLRGRFVSDDEWVMAVRKSQVWEGVR